MWQNVQKWAFIDHVQIVHARPRRCEQWRVFEGTNNVICEFLSTLSRDLAESWLELIGREFLIKCCFSTRSPPTRHSVNFKYSFNSSPPLLTRRAIVASSDRVSRNLIKRRGTIVDVFQLWSLTSFLMLKKENDYYY